MYLMPSPVGSIHHLFNFSISYPPGTTKGTADSLWRMHRSSLLQNKAEPILPESCFVAALNREQLSSHQIWAQNTWLLNTHKTNNLLHHKHWSSTINQVILVIIDLFSKWLHLIPFPKEPTARETSDCFVTKYTGISAYLRMLWVTEEHSSHPMCGKVLWRSWE